MSIFQYNRHPTINKIIIIIIMESKDSSRFENFFAEIKLQSCNFPLKKKTRVDTREAHAQA